MTDNTKNSILKNALDETITEDIERLSAESSAAPHVFRSDLSHTSEKRRKKPVRWIRYACAAAAACLLITAGFGIGKLSGGSFLSAESDTIYPGNMPGFYDEGSDSLKNSMDSVNYEYDPESCDYSPAPGKGANSDITSASAQQSNTDRKLITTYKIEGETLSFDSCITEIEKTTARLNGYIEDSSLKETPDGIRYISYTIRIPENDADSFLSTISEDFHVTYKNTSQRDVTLDYYDTKSRLDSYRNELDTLNKMMSKATEISDVIDIESRISDVTYYIDSYESSLRLLDNQVDYTTFNLTVNEVERPSATAKDSIGTRIANGFSSSVSSLCEFAENAIVWILSNIITIIIAAAVITVIILIIRKHLNKRR